MPCSHHRYFRLHKLDWKWVTHAKITLYIHTRAVYAGVIRAFVKVVRFTLVEELE